MKERVYIIVIGETTRHSFSCQQFVYIIPEEQQEMISGLKENYEKELDPFPQSLDDEEDLNLSQYKIDNLTYDYTKVEVLGLVALTY